ncbi:Uncharacterised protein [Escherichia coli]|nr:Uncharacterised protein [Escherichia coli]
MRRGGYLKIARRQLNPRRAAGAAIPERYRRRITLLPPRIYRPDCQPVVPRRQLPEAVCGFRRPGRADQPLTAVIRCYGQTEQEAHALHHLRRVPARQHLIFPAVCGDFGSQVLHCRRMTLFSEPDIGSKRAPLSTMASFSGTCCTAVMAKVPSVFSPDGNTAEQATTQ